MIMIPAVEAISRPSHGKVVAFLVLTTFFWGGSFLFTKMGVAEVPPQIFVFSRFSLATLLIAIICIPRFKRIDLATVKRGAVVGIALAVTNLTFVVGLKGTSISRAGVINNLFVLFIPVIAKLLWKDRIGRLNILGIVMAASGIALLAGGGSGFNRGDLVSTICAFFIAIHIITVSKVLKDDDVYLVSFVQFAIVTVISGVSVLIFQAPQFQFSQMAVGTIIYCAIFPTLICFTLQNRYQRYVTPTEAGLIYTLDPVWCLMAGFTVLGERLSAREWYGCGMIFMAVLLPISLRFILERRLIFRYTGHH